MALFWRRKATPYKPSVEEGTHDVRVKVVVEKEANREVAKQAREASKTLNALLEANHFTIKIYRATRNEKPEGKK